MYTICRLDLKSACLLWAPGRRLEIIREGRARHAGTIREGRARRAETARGTHAHARQTGTARGTHARVRRMETAREIHVRLWEETVREALKCQVNCLR